MTWILLAMIGILLVGLVRERVREHITPEVRTEIIEAYKKSEVHEADMLGMPTVNYWCPSDWDLEKAEAHILEDLLRRNPGGDEDYKFIRVEKDACDNCRGIGVDPKYGNDVPCWDCKGSGRVRIEE